MQTSLAHRATLVLSCSLFSNSGGVGPIGGAAAARDAGDSAEEIHLKNNSSHISIIVLPHNPSHLIQRMIKAHQTIPIYEYAPCNARFSLTRFKTKKRKKVRVFHSSFQGFGMAHREGRECSASHKLRRLHSDHRCRLRNRRLLLFPSIVARCHRDPVR